MRGHCECKKKCTEVLGMANMKLLHKAYYELEGSYEKKQYISSVVKETKAQRIRKQVSNIACYNLLIKLIIM